ncbi:helix-turn-helix domain-containing protein [Streptosporangium subroseum]|uniref:helix-turn-helix domain-containing protein n=1 Tax=Streptosporangium subroseum TaxID=106412 RepID=UPI003086FDC5|nr:helix-turn-helix domain-containing protein [Streptosporangium subroseum]
MRISPSSSARRARQGIAQRLREIRLDAGLTARAIAKTAGWHESKASKIEHSRTVPSEADIRAWCTACGAEDQVALHGDGRPYPLGQRARFAPELSVTGSQGWRDATVVVGPRSSSYLVSIRNGPDLLTVREPEQVAQMILTTPPGSTP